MNLRVVECLQCPICGSEKFATRTVVGSATEIEEGFIWCENRDWFPIEARVLEFLPSDLQYTADRARFQNKYSAELRSAGVIKDDTSISGGSVRDELGLIQAQQRHFDWYADNETQAYDAYAAMPFWKVVDRRTFAAWNLEIRNGCNNGN